MMKYILISLLCLVGVSDIHAQTLNKSWEFSNLYAADDTEGQTHLFYELNTNRKYICSDVWGSRLYNTSKGNFRHMNPATNTDSTFMHAGGFGGIGCSYSNGWINIADFHSFDNTFEHFIFVGSSGDGFEPYGYSQIGSIQYYLAPLFDYFSRIEANPYLGKYFFIPREDYTVRVPITTNQDTLEYINNNWYDLGFYEGNLSDSILTVLDFNLRSFSSFKDSLTFYTKQDTLFRSEDLGVSGDTLSIRIGNDSPFLFDRDSLHIYTTSNTGQLLVSDSYGKPDSWKEFNLRGRTSTLQTDPQKSGYLYIADSTSIYESTDFGQTFQEKYQSDRVIVDFYHKPATDVYYVMHKEQIIEVNPDSISILKSVPGDSSFELNTNTFPYQDGNEFVFTVKQKDPEDNSEFYNVLTLEEFKTTTIRDGKKINFEDESQYPLFRKLRLDSLSNLIATEWARDSSWTLMLSKRNQYEPWHPVPQTDSIIVKATYGEYVSAPTNSTIFDEGIRLVFYSQKVRESGTSFNDKIASAVWSPILGFTYFGFGVDGLRYYLKGAKINGTTYGNMTVVSNEPEPSEIPNQITLEQNFPNPFNPSTVISYQLNRNQLVRLEVFDVTGRKVTILVDGKRKSAGQHQVSFDGSGLSSGVYFYRLEAGGRTLTQKMMLVK